MKYIYYNINSPINIGTDNEPEWKDNLVWKRICYTENNEEIAKQEAHNGEYTIEDDGVEETLTLSAEERISILEQELNVLLGMEVQHE